MSVVSTTPMRRCVGSLAHDAAEPTGPAVGADGRGEPGAAQLHADAESPTLRAVGRRPGRRPGPPSWSVVIASTEAGDSRREPSGRRAAGRAACGRRRGSRRPSTPARRRRTGTPVGSPTARRAGRRRPARRSPGSSRSTCRGGRRAASANPVSAIPSGSNTRSRRNTSSGWPGGAGDEHAEDVRAGVVQPALARLVQQRQRRRAGASTRRAPAAPAVAGGPPPRPSSAIASSSGCGHGASKSMPQPSRNVSTSRSVIGRSRGDGVAVDRPARIDEHPPVGELGQQLVDRLVEAQPALLDEDQRGDRDDRLRHRGDSEDGVALHRIARRRGSARRTADGDVVVARHQPGGAAQRAVLHVAGHHLGQPIEPLAIRNRSRNVRHARRRELIGVGRAQPADARQPLNSAT